MSARLFFGGSVMIRSIAVRISVTELGGGSSCSSRSAAGAARREDHA